MWSAVGVATTTPAAPSRASSREAATSWSTPSRSMRSGSDVVDDDVDPVDRRQVPGVEPTDPSDPQHGDAHRREGIGAGARSAHACQLRGRSARSPPAPWLIEDPPPGGGRHPDRRRHGAAPRRPIVRGELPEGAGAGDALEVVGAGVLPSRDRRPSTRSTTVEVAMISPARPWAMTRVAMTTATPSTSPSRTSTSPKWTPVRTGTSRASARADSSAPAATASPGLSKVARWPSPVNFTTRPPWRAIADRLPSSRSPMTLRQAGVAHRRGEAGGVDDVVADDGEEAPLRHRLPDPTGDEVLGEGRHLVGHGDLDDVVRGGQERRAGCRGSHRPSGARSPRGRSCPARRG